MDINLMINFGGLQLRSPLIVGSCPMTADAPTRIAMQSSGAGAIALPSLFEEQVIAWAKRNGKQLTSREQRLLSLSEANDIEQTCGDVESYLSMVRQASEESSIPIIASINGEVGGHWADVAVQLQTFGADAIEILLHHPAPGHPLHPNTIEDMVVATVSQIQQHVNIPLFVKLSPEHTSHSHLAHRLLSGANGLILFGRQPNLDICLDNFELKRHWDLTHCGGIGQSIGPIMRIHRHCPAMPLAACGGIGSSGDLIKALLAGADVAMVTSAIYREGPDVIRKFLDGLKNFMRTRKLSSLPELFEKRPLEFDSDRERQEYIYALSSRPESFEEGCNDHAMEGDRWGHPS